VARIVKHPEQRKSELLTCAQELFFERGYENTTVNDVIEKAGVSKGAFYHYFESKEALLEALAERLAREGVERVADVLEDPALDALSRLNSFLAKFRRLRMESAPVMPGIRADLSGGTSAASPESAAKRRRGHRIAFGAVFQPENIVLYHRINAAVMSVMTPVLARIIAQGVEEGVFHNMDPVAVAEMLLHLGGATHAAVARAMQAQTEIEKDEAADALENLLRLHGAAIDRILGLREGSIRLAEPGYTRAVMAARTS
jgi:AcrR family transcriptional regulator